jgi:copper chaperone NosL
MKLSNLFSISVTVSRTLRLALIVVTLSLTLITNIYGREKKPIKPSPKDKCPVCGMFVAKYPDFLAEILFKDGSYAFFDGPKDMFKYFFQIRKYEPTRDRSGIDSIYVTDYYSLSLIDAYLAYYVVGSDIFGPMGRELIPFGKEADAREFLKDHKGKLLIRFQEITFEMIKGLD